MLHVKEALQHAHYERSMLLTIINWNSLLSDITAVPMFTVFQKCLKRFKTECSHSFLIVLRCSAVSYTVHSGSAVVTDRPL